MYRRDRLIRYWTKMRSYIVGTSIITTLVITAYLNLLVPALIPTDLRLEDSAPFEPDVLEDFPTVDSDKPRIPHIIHQTYKTTQIPSAFTSYVKSFVTYNPGWTYVFWTDESARKLISDRHPYLLKLWDNYKLPINKADALRYVVLYEFGGVYADLDYECLRPLDRVTMKYACIFPTEPFEHSVFRNEIPYFINNAIMLCRPKHPFIKQILENLARTRVMIEQIDVAGPAFITFNFLVYNNITDIYKTKTTNDSNSPYFYKGDLPEDDINAVYVPNSIYFMNTLDEHLGSERKYYKICSKFYELNSLLRRACVNLYRRGFHREDHVYTFAKHHWFQTYITIFSTDSFIRKWYHGTFLVELESIVPNYQIYGETFN